jgi:4-amino-4-deoxy-L-arabinose transferase-like glycosyltransferase
MKSSDSRLAIALILVFTFSCWLTGQNWIESYDGEAVFLVTESLVERKSFAVPPPQPEDVPRSIVQATDGRYYSVTAPLQSILAVPFYLVGKWTSTLFPAPFEAYFTRFFATLLNGLVHAATVALLYVFSVDLRYRRRTALFIAIAYGMTTIGWPYARTFFSETLHTFWLVLAVWSAHRYARSERWLWLSLTGAALGFGFLSKYVMAVVGPALGLYLLMVWWRHSDRDFIPRTIRIVLSFGLPLVILIGLAFLFNQQRFGNIWETGYTMDTARGSINTWGRKAEPIVSLYSFFLSPGKSFFLFSPLTILLLWSVVPAARRYQDKSILVLFLMILIIYPLFYSFITWRWFGGANWGPRYIVCVTPFALLPIGAYLERRNLPRWLRVGSATALFVIGFWIQLSVVLVAPAYISSSTRFNDQLYHPRHSALLEQWRLWSVRSKAWLQYDFEKRQAPPFYWFSGEVYAVEVPSQSPYGRWMKEKVGFYIYAHPNRRLEIQLHYSYPQQKDVSPEAWQGLSLTYDGIPLQSSLQRVAEQGQDIQWRQTAPVPVEVMKKYPGTLVVTTDASPIAGDQRELGVFLSNVLILSDEVSVPYQEVALPWPLPVSSVDLWSDAAKYWFGDPRIGRLLNVWPWYLDITGIPISQARHFMAIWGGFLSGGLILSSIFLVKRLDFCTGAACA